MIKQRHRGNFYTYLHAIHQLALEIILYLCALDVVFVFCLLELLAEQSEYGPVISRGLTIS